MSDIINLPATIITTEQLDSGEIIENNVASTVSATLVENEINSEEKLIKSIQYLPDFLQDKPVMKDASKLLDALLDEDQETLKDIREAYFDTLYKLPGYSNLSYGAKIALLKEKGFEYLLDLLLHMYDEEYNALDEDYRKVVTYDQYVEQKCDGALSNLTALFNLLYILKGKTVGLELAFKLIDLPQFLYISWDIIADYKGVWDGSVETLPLPGGDVAVSKGDCYTVVSGYVESYYIYNGVSWHYCEDWQSYTTQREAFTAQLIVYGMGSTDLQARIVEFIRYYMLPYITVSLNFTASVTPVTVYPCGAFTLLNTLLLWDYYDDNGDLQQHNLQHSISDAQWKYSDYFDIIQILMGKTTESTTAFQGQIDLNNSYVETTDGTRIPLYGTTQIIPDVITGTAINKYTTEDTIVDFDGDWLAAPIEKGYVDIDIITGDQINAYYVKDSKTDEIVSFERDTIVKFFTSLVVEGIHYAKTVAEMETLLIGDFDKEIDGTEVYAGRTTLIDVKSGGCNLEAETTEPEVREIVGIEDTIHLKYTNAFVNSEGYTGIGDLGILGANNYFIYNGMLWTASGEELTQITDDSDWQDIGASHATGSSYYTPAVKGGKLYSLLGDNIHNIERDANRLDCYTTNVIHYEDKLVEEVDSSEIEDLNLTTLESWTESTDISFWEDVEEAGWTHVTGYVNEFFTGYAICDGYLYALAINNQYDQSDTSSNPLVYYQVDSEQGWSYVTGVLYSETYQAFAIKNQRLYRISEDGPIEIKQTSPSEQELIGWDDSFDCIGRYYHSNTSYSTYGICAGRLYYINNDEVLELTGTEIDPQSWTAVCGFYNEDSPRTFGYAINDSVLYELQGKDIVLKDNNLIWKDISGCTTSTVTFILALGQESLESVGGAVYAINAQTTKKLYDTTDWTEVIGRYTTSSAASSACFGFGIRDRRFFVFDKDSIQTISGLWKKDGIGAIVDLADYNISNITITLEDGTVLSTMDEITATVPVDENDSESNYDIYVTYETVGFENNTRYNIRAELTDTDFTYVAPEECREDMWETNVEGRFSTDTGLIESFIDCNYSSIGSQQITGDGLANGFNIEKSYIKLPELQDASTDTIILKLECYCSSENQVLQMAIYDELMGTGICYGYKENTQEYGLFAKVKSSTDFVWVNILTLDPDKTSQIYLKFIKMNETNYLVETSLDNITYQTGFLSVDTNEEQFILYRPCYLGGNGVEYCDASFYLSECSVTDSEETKYLLVNGNYFSLLTNDMDIVELINTNSNQGNQKVIELLNEDKNKLLDFNMNTLYTSMDVTNIVGDLSVTNTFNYETLQRGDNEGITTSTLSFAGSYELDPIKAKEVGDLKASSGYNITTIANNFNESNYLEINPEYISSESDNALIITTGSSVTSQCLFKTEEDEAYTNQYLLTSELTGSTSNPDLDITFVPSGEVYEYYTDSPQITTKQVVFNAEAFQVDETKIQGGIYDVSYDSYTGQLSGFANQEEECYVTIPFDLSGEVLEDGSFDNIPTLNIITQTANDQKIMVFDGVDICIGNIIVEDLTTEETDTNEEELEEIITVLEEESEEDLEESEEEFVYMQNTPYYLKWNIHTDVKDLNTNRVTKVEDSSQEEKDHFVFNNGVVTNFSQNNYFEIKDLTETYGLLLCFNMSDDTSIDQALFGSINGCTIGIKDNYFCYTDASGQVTMSSKIARCNYTYYLSFKCLQEDGTYGTLYEPTVEISQDLQNWEVLFSDDFKFPAFDSNVIGLGLVAADNLPFLGSVDLTRSYVETLITDIDPESLTQEFNLDMLFELVQTSKLQISLEKDGEYTTIQEIITPYVVTEVTFGYAFDGTLDLYESDLLLPYTLQWLDNDTRLNINDSVRNLLASIDSSYDAEADTTIYSLEAYGIQLNEESIPQRWDKISVTYETEDNAYYLTSNTNYYLKCLVEQDTESGKNQLDIIGNPSWENAVVTDFTLDNYLSYNIQSEDTALLIKFKTGADILTSQGICGYTDLISQSLYIQNETLCLFNGYISKAVMEVLPNTEYLIKLHTTDSNIEYSLDNGNTWIITDIVTSFNGYDTLQIGLASTNDSEQKPFLGSINLNQSCLYNNENIIYLFTYYKKITPMISKTGYTYYPLTITPMLTIQDFISFGTNYNGSMDLYNSNLLLDDTIYWQTNVIKIYDKFTQDCTKVVYRDSWQIDSDNYYMIEQLETVDVSKLDIKISGLPLIGDTITLTYNTWYLFRDIDSSYEFHIDYNYQNTGLCYIYYNKVGEENIYLLYIMNPINMYVNTGFSFWGSLDVKDSTRGGMTFAEHLEWNTYDVTYKKAVDNDWTLWTQFTVNQDVKTFMRSGYELNGTMFLTSSYVVTESFHTPFLAYYNSAYILPVGDVDITNGVASQFTQDSYLEMIPASLLDGYKVSFDIIPSTDVSNQGVGTNALIENQYLCYSPNTDIQFQKLFVNKKTCLQYLFENDQMRICSINQDGTTAIPAQINPITITVIPINKLMDSSSSGYYVQNATYLDIIHLDYRIINTNETYDHCTHSGSAVWYPVTPTYKSHLTYFDQTLTELYVYELQFLELPQTITLCEGQLIEYRLYAGSLDNLTSISYNTTSVNSDMIYLQNCLFS